MFKVFNGDNISSFLGAPPNHWKKSEIQQMRQIHQCYKRAFRADDDDEHNLEVTQTDREQFSINVGGQTITKPKPTRRREEDGGGDKEEEEKGDDEEEKKDEEDYLPKDSPLRSKGGDKRVPKNPVFKDYDTFLSSCHFENWSEYFQNQCQDQFLSETAEAIVSNICNAQSRAELRVKNGHIPLRKKREQITPLALVLHELKLWATHDLRNSSVFEEKTYKGLRCRIRYLDALSHKEVWGETAPMLGSGMRSLAHDKLFRLFLNMKEALTRAQEYAYRGYCRRSSREKLARAGHLLKNVILREMKTLSMLMTIDDKLTDPRTRRLNPTDLLNSIQNQSFVDYRNLVNVLLYRLCQNPMVQAVLTTEYEKEEVKEVIEDLENWTRNNLFCVPSHHPEEKEPDYLLDTNKERKMLPEIYEPTANHLARLIKASDPSAPIPSPGKKHVKSMTTAFEGPTAAAEVMKLVMRNAAAIQNIFPMVYALHQLWLLAGDGGDLTVYDTLREQVMDVMKTTISHLQDIENTQKALLKEFGHLVHVKEKAMEQRRLKDKKARFKPAWVMNYKYINSEIIKVNMKGYGETRAQLFELAEDAYEYNLSSDQLDDKVEGVKKLVSALTGKPIPTSQTVAEVQTLEQAPPPKKPKDAWDHESRMVSADTDHGFGANNNFGDNDDWAGESTMEKYNPFEGADDESSDEEGGI